MPFAKLYRIGGSQRAAGIIDALVGIAILAAFTLASANVITNSSRMAENTEDRARRAAIIRMIAETVDCRATINSPQLMADCQAGSPLTLRYSDLSAVGSGSAPGLPAGSRAIAPGWAVKARCDAARKTITVSLLHHAANGHFLEDEFGRPYDENHPSNPELGDEFPFCGVVFAGGASVSAQYLNYQFVDTAMTYTGNEDCEDMNHDDEAGYYQGYSQCPVGTKLVTGAVICTLPGRTANSYPNLATNGWYGNCCSSGKIRVYCEPTTP